MPPPTPFLARLRSWLVGRRAGAPQPGAERRRNPALREAIDRVVAGTDPRIRALSGYGRRLRPAVERMLAYLETCGRWPAAPIEFSARAWGDDPLVRLLFANAEELRRVFSGSAALRAFFRDHPQAAEAYVGLAATRRERQVFGTALYGEVLQRGVAQTTVQFTEHAVFGVCASERALRAQVEQRGFAYLVGEALERLAADPSRCQQLDAERHRLALQLKALEHKHQALDALFEVPAASAARLDELRRRLAATADALAAVPLHPPTLERAIDQICAVLSQPERHLAEKRTSLRVNRMNVKVDAADEPAEQVVFSEITVGRHPPRLVVLGRFPRRELLPACDPLAAAERALGG